MKGVFLSPEPMPLISQYSINGIQFLGISIEFYLFISCTVESLKSQIKFKNLSNYIN